MDFTPIARLGFLNRARRVDQWEGRTREVQLSTLRSLICGAKGAEVASVNGFEEMLSSGKLYEQFSARLDPVVYEDIRSTVMRMVAGEPNLLWPGVCRTYAQSSGTSGGRSKYIPITERSLHRCHYAGASDPVAHYLRQNPHSRLFSGRAMILGGSFANELNLEGTDVKVGDLSATLIERINPLANIFRVPDKRTALLSDWREKLPALVEAGLRANVTNISGVPSWFMTVLREMMSRAGVSNLHEIWPNLEVFFHGGISFEPYRHEYESFTDPAKMHFVETYNSSEGFFAVQNDMNDRSMLLTIDNDVFYEFERVDGMGAGPIPLWEVEKGMVYEMLITSSNGLWRYRLGDTVRIEQTNPVKIRIAGRTKCFINAFGEELMEENAERAMSIVGKRHGAYAANYTVAPLFAEGQRRGRHQWFVEWRKEPSDVAAFAKDLDDELRRLNSDYDAKRANTIFLDPLEVISVPAGTFNRWLSKAGNGKLGGQRKVPRLSNDRKLVDSLEL